MALQSDYQADMSMSSREACVNVHAAVDIEKQVSQTFHYSDVHFYNEAAWRNCTFPFSPLRGALITFNLPY